MQKAAAALVAQPIAVAPDRDDLAVVQQPIEDGGGGDRVAKHLPPFANRPVAGDQHAGPLIAPRHELEEQVRGRRLKWQVAQFIDDQQLGLGELQQLLLEPAIGVRLRQPGHQRRRRGKEHRVAAIHRFAPEGNRQVISYRLSTHVRGFGAGLYAGSGIGWLRRDWRTSSGTLNCAATIRLPSWTEIELPS